MRTKDLNNEFRKEEVSINMQRSFNTSINLFKHYGFIGLVKGILNKIKGRNLLYGISPKPPHKPLIKSKIRTAINLFRQFGLTGFVKGISNKIRGKNLLDGIVSPSAAIHDTPNETIPTTAITLFDVSRYLLSTPNQYSDTHDYSCTIVIPVYNGMAHLKRLLPSIVAHTPKSINILFVNDASPDHEIVPFIQSYIAQNPHWQLIENSENYGFVKTVNRAMAMVRTDYAILLNTDTMVPENWIPKMLTPFLENEKVATTTPFTNAGVYFSFPHFGYDNEPKWDLSTINHAFSYVVSNEYALNEIPSGTGFCMGINMKCWRQIGELDYENFGKGYGEENDWCFRALEHGWRHLIVPNLFVHHFHGGSFMSEEKQKLCDAHQKILQRKYPKFIFNDLPAFYQRDPWKPYRYAAAIKLSAKNTILYINLKPEASDVSGAVDYANKELNELENGENSIIIAQYVRGTKRWSIVPYSADSSMEIPLDDITDLFMLFEMTDIKKVIINNLAFCENAEKAAYVFTKLRGLYEFQMIYKFHDYLSICPNFFLINKDKTPCNPSNTTICSDYCKDCIRQSRIKAVQRDYLAEWRLTFDHLFHSVDSVFFFSHYTKNIVTKIYPQLIEKAQVKFHEPLFTGNESKYMRPSYTGQWNIAFVGNFCMEKGAEYFIDMKLLFDQKQIKSRFIIVGENNSGQQLPGIEVLGKYNRENLGQLLTDNKIHMVLYPSINNETFSYVAQELMLLSVPFVVFPCGAPQERITQSHYHLAQVANEVRLESLYKATKHLVKYVYKKDLH